MSPQPDELPTPPHELPDPAHHPAWSSENEDAPFTASPEQERREALEERAIRAALAMAGTLSGSMILRLIQRAELAFAVFPETEEPSVHGVLALKGDAVLDAVASGTLITWTAVPFPDRSAAEGVRRLLAGCAA